MSVFEAMDAAGWTYEMQDGVFCKGEMAVTFAQAAEALRLANVGVDLSVLVTFAPENDNAGH